MAQTKRQKRIADDNESFDQISFTDLVLHTLLDKFEFSAHSFDDIHGPYFWNGLGIDFQSPMPKKEVLRHAKSANARRIYAAHTHPLCNDESFRFLDAQIDPREEIAYGYRPLPIGNKPSSGDISFFIKLKEEFASENIDVVGVIFSASGLWEYDIPNLSVFNVDQFIHAYENFYSGDSGDFSDQINEWTARGEFPDYFMELEKPKMHQSTYKTQITKVKQAPNVTIGKDISKTVGFFQNNGITIDFHAYTMFGIEPQHLMRRAIKQWTNVFP